jgi:hypothetical protein
MGFWDQMGIGFLALAIVCAAIVGLWLLKVTAIGAVRMVDCLLRPLERRMLQWLQDRATARTLGIDIDIIRARRKIETSESPVQTHAEKPIRY